MVEQIHESWKVIVVILSVWYLDLQLHVQSVHIGTKVVSSNPAPAEVFTCKYILPVDILRKIKMMPYAPPYIYTIYVHCHKIYNLFRNR